MTGTAPPAPARILREARWTIRSIRPPQDAQSARVQAWTCLALFGWPGPVASAISVLDHLVRNASEFGRCAGGEIEVRLARTESDDLLIDVMDRRTNFASFDQAVAGHLGQGLWRIAQYGATLSWHPHRDGKTVRAVLGATQAP
ncbi:ATP-binding protein [Streptomyces microflavus]|uniref:ATP-binding protein n=1 Tax=Streptomyces microflavus TaxID=1919 RepID=UPI0033B73504